MSMRDKIFIIWAISWTINLLAFITSAEVLKTYQIILGVVSATSIHAFLLYFILHIPTTEEVKQ